MKITEVENGLTKAHRNGTDYLTEGEIGEVGDVLTLKSGRWINFRTEQSVSETFLVGDYEAQYQKLDAEMNPETKTKI